MANINKIRLSGTSYDIQDLNATKVVDITQAAYDALPSSAKTANILYNITDAEAIDISEYWTSAETQSAITEATSGKLSTSDFNTYSGSVNTALNSKASQTDLNTLSGTVAAHTANTLIHVSAEQIAAWNAKSNFSGDYNDLTNKLSAGTNITIIDNVISAEGDSGTVSSAITSGDTNAVAGGAVYDRFDEVEQVTAQALNVLNESLSGKQDTLSAGTGIDITSNVISVTGSTGGKAIEAGRGISVTTGATADTISVSLPISAGTGTNSVIEGHDTRASGNYSHAEGYQTTASGNYSHAEGFGTLASGLNSHAEGTITKANGYYSHAEGQGTTANTACSHTEGRYTITNNVAEHASGQFNISNSASTEFGDSGNTLFSVGNGRPNSARHNAFEIRQNGDIYISSGGTDIKLQDHLGGGGSGTVSSAITSGDTNAVAGGAVYDKFDEVEQVTAQALNVLNDRVTEDEEVTAAALVNLNEALSGKQDTLSAGTNITIVDNVISAEGGDISIDPSFDRDSTNAIANSAVTRNTVGSYDSALTGGKTFLRAYDQKGHSVDKLSIGFSKINNTPIFKKYSNLFELTNFSLVETSAITSAITSSSTDAQVPSAKAVNDKLGGLSLVKLTQAQYDALATKDNSTLYVIVN